MTISHTATQSGTLIDALRRMEREMADKGGSQQAAKIRELREKEQAGECIIAFCGHFSAGKSTLVNTVLGERLLPSSPTPASANVVRLQAGSPSARIRRGANADGEPETIPLDQLEASCLDGERIRFIDIHYPSEFLMQTGLVLLDTPGIDSTDEDHHAATASALHMCDVVFYVTDYNHVLSEMNLGFVEQMKKAGKPVYLLINQVDKHDERETSMADYRERIRTTFANWEAVPDGMLTLSMVDPDHPHHEWERFMWLMQQLSDRRHELRSAGIRHAAATCIREYADEQIAAYDREHGSNSAGKDGMSMAEVRAEVSRLDKRIAELEHEPEQMEQRFKTEIRSLLDHAKIMPAVTRDKAALFLESIQPGFRSGWWSGKKKTEQERAARATSLLRELNENVDTGVRFHLLTMFEQAFNEYGMSIENEDDLASWNNLLDVRIDEPWLRSFHESGAVLSSQYVIQYSQALAEGIRARYRQCCWQLLDRLLEQMRHTQKQERESIKQQRKPYAVILEQEDERARFQQSVAQTCAHWERLLGGVQTMAPLPDPADASIATERTVFVDHNADTVRRMTTKSTDSLKSRPAADRPASPANTEERHSAAAEQSLVIQAKRSQTLTKLDQALELVADLPLLSEIADAIQSKRKRMESSQAGVALFGAFSAGKSTLINSMLGERVLPVSPHPTTASVTRVLPPDSQHPHQTAVVHMKTAETIEAELKDAFARIGREYPGLEASVREVAKLQPSGLNGPARNRYDFLKAIAAGWKEARSQFGRSLTVDMDMFRQYAAEEQRSAFVDRIDLYFDSPLAQAGVALIDTPGADSVNARHTGVAFEYLKSADAIVYVSYYNHAFSRADSAFLRQLGQVKDRFERDKMFFVINAADLAHSAAELQHVTDHVNEQLLQHGIRQPRLFPLSGKEALKAKKNRDKERLHRSGMAEFEQEFLRFLSTEMTGLVMRTAYKEIERSAEAIERWLQTLEQESGRKEQAKEELLQTNTRLESRLNERLIQSERERIDRELRELVFHAKNRILYRFGESFQAAFHPSAFREGQQEVKTQLAVAWQELYADLSTQCAREMQTVSLHIENRLGEWMTEAYEQAVEEIVKQLPAYAAAELQQPTWTTPDMNERLSLSMPAVKELQRLFRNAKYFFEGEGKVQLRERLEPQFMDAVTSYADVQTERMLNHYDREWADRLKQSWSRLVPSVKHHIETSIRSLEEEVDRTDLTERKNRLLQLLPSDNSII